MTAQMFIVAMLTVGGIAVVGMITIAFVRRDGGGSARLHLKNGEKTIDAQIDTSPPST